MGERTLAGQTAAVTGGTRGIGLAISRALVAQGVDVMLCGRDADAARQVAHELTEMGPGRAAGAQCDVASYDSAAAFVAQAVATFNRIDILVNNAGIGIFAPASELEPAAFRRVIETNVIGVFNCCHAAIPHMRDGGGGYIINISSLAAKNAFPGGAAYNASKFALTGLSEALMQDVRYDNIRVSYIMPGSVATEFNNRQATDGAEWKLHPEDIAAVVVDLVRTDPRALASRVELRPSRPKK